MRHLIDDDTKWDPLVWLVWLALFVLLVYVTCVDTIGEVEK